MAEPFDLMQWAEEPDGESGGNGIIGQITIVATWVAFGGPERRANFDVIAEEDDDPQRALCAAYIDEHNLFFKSGKKANPLKALRFVIHGDAVINRDPSKWIGGNLDETILPFSDGYKDSLKPSLAQLMELEYKFGDRVWAQVGYAKDGTYTTTSGEEKDNLVPYVVQVFDNNEAAVEAAGDGVVNSTPLPPEPPEWDGTVDKWVDVLNDLKSTMNAKPTLGVDQFIEMWAQPEVGLTNEVVAQVFAIALEERENEDIPF